MIPSNLVISWSQGWCSIISWGRTLRWTEGTLTSIALHDTYFGDVWSEFHDFMNDQIFWTKNHLVTWGHLAGSFADLSIRILSFVQVLSEFRSWDMAWRWTLSAWSQSHTKPSYTASLGSRDHNVLLSHDRKNMLPPLSSPMAHCYTILLWRVSGVKVRPNQLRTLSPPLSDCLCIIYIIYMWIMELPTSSQLIRSGATKLWYSDDILCRWSVISSIDLHCTTDCKHELLHLLPLCWREFKLNKVSGYLLISY